MIIWIELAIVFVLLCASSFFSAAETALAAVNKPRLKQMISKYPGRAAGIKLWLEEPNKMLTTILIAISIVNILAASLVAKISIQLAEVYLWNDWLVWSVTTLGVTICIIIFCEVAPKIIAIHSPVRMVMRVMKPIMLVQRVLAPIAGALVYITSKVLALAGIKQVNSLPVVTEDDIRTIIDIGKEEGAIANQEGRMLQSVLAFRETLVREVMVPRNEVVMVAEDAGYEAVLDIIVKHGLSRIPVYRENRDTIAGVLYAKDYLSTSRGSKRVALRDIYRPATFVPETKKISQLLLEFQRGRLHQAIAVDEYGGVAGLVTMEDIIEELVGEIRDEYDKVETDNIVKTGTREYLVKGMTDIDDVNRELGLKLEKTEGVETMSGMVVDHLGALPRVGKKVQFADVSIRVKEVDKMRVKSLQVELLGKSSRPKKTSSRRSKK